MAAVPLRSCAENISWAWSRRASPRDRLSVRDVSARLLSDVRLICNSSPFLLRQTSGRVALSGTGQGRAGKKTWDQHEADCVFRHAANGFLAALLCYPAACDRWHVPFFFFSGVGGAFSQSSSAPPQLPLPLWFTVAVLRARLRHAWGTSAGLKIKRRKRCKERGEEERSERGGRGGDAMRGDG